MKSEEIDIMSTLMVDLRISDDLQDRVFEYYDKINQLNYITNHHVYELLSPCLSDVIKLFQIELTVIKLPFINPDNRMQIEKFTRHIKLSFFLAGDIIIKQGLNNDKLYYVHKGLAEAIIEHKDFEHFNHQKVEEYMHNTNYIKHISKNEKYETENVNGIDKSKAGISSKITPKDSNTSNQLTTLFMHNLAIARTNREQENTNRKVSPYTDGENVSAYNFVRNKSKLSDSVDSFIEDSIESLVYKSK